MSCNRGTDRSECRGNQRTWRQRDCSAVMDVSRAAQPGSEEDEEAPPSAVGPGACGSAPLVWGAAEVRAVRAAGLVGALLGALPRQPRQNGRLGRPLRLSREERRLLAESRPGAAAPPDPAPPPDPALPSGQQEGEGGEAHRRLVERYEAAQERSYEEQSVLALEDRKVALLRAVAGGTAGEAAAARLEALDRSFAFPRSAMAVQLSTARAGLTHCPEGRDFLRAGPPAARPPDPRSDTRYRVFRDLRGRGFYLTSAGKFGGDFLVYPGDPLRFHAHFIAVCLSRDEPLPLLDVLAVARLGSNVKKTVLLCSPGPEDGDGDGGVVYTSLQWSGMV
ncbi:tRNA-splicing endonuclease subunit Sen34 isoform X2 [Centroberyx affinis]|uniref:tRNA-splicing endonuclease subunit Sen34 isoform X2 n=1 Tax=Centroberyx affinis TaxID=166261 RepID=UPI003A5C2588